jgi:hypothetical protein
VWRARAREEEEEGQRHHHHHHHNSTTPDKEAAMSDGATPGEAYYAILRALIAGGSMTWVRLADD